MVDLLVSWGPMLLLIAVWVFYVRRYIAQPRPWHATYIARDMQHMERVETLLERIAAAVERRPN